MTQRKWQSGKSGKSDRKTVAKVMMIKSYRDLLVWKKADDLAFGIYKMTETFPKQYLYDLTSQLRRASLSIPTNLAEGSASPHTKELLQFISIAHRSLSETRYLIEFAGRLDLIDASKTTALEGQCREIGKMLAALTSSIRQKEK